MPPVVIPGVFQVRLVWQLSAVDIAVNIHHFETAGPPPDDIATVNAIAGTYYDAFTSSGMQALVAPAVSFNRVGVRWIGAPNFPLVESTAPGPIGTATSDVLPPAVSLVATFRTGFAGRRFRGRHYQYGLSEQTNTVAGVAGTSTQTALEDFLNAVRANMLGGGWVMGVASTRALDATGALIPPSIEPIEVIQVRDGRWDTQRRRSEPGI